MKRKLNMIIDIAKIYFAIMLFIIVSGLFAPMAVSSLLVALIDSMTYEVCLLHPLFIVSTVLGMVLVFILVIISISSFVDQKKAIIKELEIEAELLVKQAKVSKDYMEEKRKFSKENFTS